MIVLNLEFHEPSGLLSDVFFDLSVLDGRPPHQVFVFGHVFLFEILNALLLVLKLLLDDLFLGVLEYDSVQLDDGVGLRHASSVAFVRA